jgi:S-adenosylhomocysteine hydrolase
MRNRIDLDPAFQDPDQRLDVPMPILGDWVDSLCGERPLAGHAALLVQHQLSNQVPQVEALLALGLDPRHLYWLDIPYTAHDAVREHVRDVLGVPDANLARHDYRVLDPYAPYQRRRAVEMVLAVQRRAPERLLVLDDGAYVLEALSTLDRARWPHEVAIVEQTSRGFIKLGESAALRATARQVTLIDVARSPPKKRLEPPFIAMAVCSALARQLDRHLKGRTPARVLLLGYGAIGRQVASFVRVHLGLPRQRVHVHDTDVGKAEAARALGYPPWDKNDLGTRFDLVLGCSGEASFRIGDSAYLRDGALLASASSGAVELSRQDFLELADGSDLDDVAIDRRRLDERDVHSDLEIRLVDRVVTFANGGFPINFDGRLATIPAEYMQPTATMMVAAAVQAARTREPGQYQLDAAFCGWIEASYRRFLGERAAWLDDPPEESRVRRPAILE